MTHHDLIRDQFTKQALPFAEAPGIRDEEALQLLVRMSGAGQIDSVLDVACGPGVVACAFAPAARSVTGIDLTPAMVALAEKLKAEKGLRNASFQVGDVLPLPFADGAFTIVLSRYSFHHFPDPLAVLREMKRVCAPGGKVMVADVAVSEDSRKAAAYNRMEKLRDSSHVRALALTELEDLFRHAGLPAPQRAFYRFAVELEGVLSRSFPVPGGAAEIRRLFAESLQDDGLGVEARREGEEIRFAYPIAVLLSAVPATR